MLKKMMLTAVVALAAVVIPASAASASWLHEGIPIEQTETMHLEGNLKFTAPATGANVDCKATVDLEMTVGTTDGHTRNFNVFEETCKPGGPLAGCVVKEVHATNGWTATISSGVVKINGFHVENTYVTPDADCPVTTTTVVDAGADEVIATPDKASEISHLTISGKASAGNLNISGSLTPTIAKTHGIKG